MQGAVNEVKGCIIPKIVKLLTYSMATNQTNLIFFHGELG